MKVKMKIALCVMLALFAAVSLAAVLGDLGVIPVSAAGEGYLLRECGGYIGIYSPPEAAYPCTVTDIPVRGLPLGDRLELADGVIAADYGAVVRLLEDYGA